MDDRKGHDEPMIGFIGAGTLGKGLAMALSGRGYQVVGVSSRSWASAKDLADRVPGCEALASPQELADKCHLVFISTTDEVINQVASQVEWRRDHGVVHCSGAEPLEVLEPVASLGAATGSFHPFQTFACLETMDEALQRLEGITFTVEGEGWLLGFLKEMASRLGGKAISLSPEDRAIYHASAVMSSGYLVALVKAATDMWQAMGVPPEEALSIILPMAKSTLTILPSRGIAASVTGPLVRGDTTVAQCHLEALEARLPQLIPLYCALSMESFPLARDKISKDKLEEMEQLIGDYLRRYIKRTHG